MSKAPKPSKSKPIDEIGKHAARRGVTIFLDGDDVSKAAQEGKKYDYAEDGKILTIVLSPCTLNAINVKFTFYIFTG